MSAITENGVGVKGKIHKSLKLKRKMRGRRKEIKFGHYASMY